MAATVASLLLIIMCSAVMFSQLLTVTGSTRALGELVVGLSLPAMFMLFAMMARAVRAVHVSRPDRADAYTVPIYQPIIKIYQFDDIWFWTLFLIVATVGGLTPPFGYVLFALKSAAPDVPMQDDLPRILAVRVDHHAGHAGHGVCPELIILLPRLMGP